MKISESCRFCGWMPGEFSVQNGQITPEGKQNQVDRYWVSCSNPQCYADGPLGRSPEEAIRKWNKGVS